VDLWFTDATQDLMTVFIDCLVQLPNVKALEVFGINNTSLVARGLERKCARFPSIRELWVDGLSVVFVGRCPNVESVTITGRYSQDTELLCTYGRRFKRLKRVAGVHKECIEQGELTETFWSETAHYGSCTGLPGPPGNLHQGYDWEYPYNYCKESHASRTSGTHVPLALA